VKLNIQELQQVRDAAARQGRHHAEKGRPTMARAAYDLSHACEVYSALSIVGAAQEAERDANRNSKEQSEQAQTPKG
jgi:hypothetical protein